MIDDDILKHVKNAKKRPFKVEAKYFRPHFAGGGGFTKWYHWDNYATEKSRQQGLAQLRKSHPQMQFRAVK